MKCGPAWLPSCVFVLATGIAGTAGGFALAERAEALFLRQQSVQSSLVSTVSEVETVRPRLAARLYGLEDDLHTACRPLREASRRRLDGQDLGPNLEWAVVTTLQKCESATSTIEHLVQEAKAGNLGEGPLVDIIPAGLSGW